MLQKTKQKTKTKKHLQEIISKYFKEHVGIINSLNTVSKTDFFYNCQTVMVG